ncbi:MAG: DUF3179 domain-containing protein [Bacteroidales bacterium]|nr:DUF3179 domain-containing protein [Bacteroidales bacterium]
MKRILFIGLLFSLMLLWGCGKETGSNGNSSVQGSGAQEAWAIPREDIFDGGPGKDGIPALLEPEFVSAAAADYLSDEELVIGIVVDGEARAYPHHILDWHEIINDRVGQVDIAVTYCPLTGTGIGWSREIDGSITTFGVSGLLYNSNLIPYDRKTDSNWSQIRLDCVNGALRGTKAETFPLIETSWRTWKEMYPQTTVVTRNTGYDRNYGRYPYGSYRTEDDFLMFPVTNEDDRIPNKERVLGVLQSDEVRVYRFAGFDDSITVVHDHLRGKNLVIVGNQEDNFLLAFINDPGDGSTLSFGAVQGQYPVVMTDDEGNKWDVSGQAVSGPRKNARLGTIPSFLGYWFSFAAFYPDVSIYGTL